MSVLLKHENTVFEDQTIYATGSAYVGCTFRRCAIVVVNTANMVFDNCGFEACIWHVNAVIHDHESCAAMEKLLGFVRQSVPTVRGKSGAAAFLSLN
jgi:hypothetical protein